MSWFLPNVSDSKQINLGKMGKPCFCLWFHDLITCNLPLIHVTQNLLILMNIPITPYDYDVFNEEVFMIQQLNGPKTTSNINRWHRTLYTVNNQRTLSYPRINKKACFMIKDVLIIEKQDYSIFWLLQHLNVKHWLFEL